jgi:hypothetical protein
MGKYSKMNLLQFKIGRDNSRKTCPWLSLDQAKENTYYQRLNTE